MAKEFDEESATPAELREEVVRLRTKIRKNKSSFEDLRASANEWRDRALVAEAKLEQATQLLSQKAEPSDLDLLVQTLERVAKKKKSITSFF